MKTLIYLAILAILCCISVGCGNKDEEIIMNQKECYVQVADNWTLHTLDGGLEYLDGGESGYHNNIIGNVNYPSEARENGVEGIAIIRYEVTTEGMVENIEITQDPGTGIGEETKRVVELATAGIPFTPAILNGNPVRVRKEYELMFSIR